MKMCGGFLMGLCLFYGGSYAASLEQRGARHHKRPLHKLPEGLFRSTDRKGTSTFYVGSVRSGDLAAQRRWLLQQSAPTDEPSTDLHKQKKASASGQENNIKAGDKNTVSEDDMSDVEDSGSEEHWMTRDMDL